MTNQTPSTRRRRRRRARILGIVVGAIAVAAVLPAGASAKTVSVPTNTYLQYQPPGLGVTPFIFGGFSTPKKACETRTIDVFRSTDLINWDYAWFADDVTGPNPGLTKDLANSDRGYYYVLSVERKTIKKRGKKIVCQPQQSEAVYAS
jgi:hypothetical protein